MKMIEAAKVAPLVMLLLHDHPEEEAIMQLIHTIVDHHTIEAEPVRHGRYITDEMGDSSCSVCGEKYLNATRNYCPNCGAKMDLEEDE